MIKKWLLLAMLVSSHEAIAQEVKTLEFRSTIDSNHGTFIFDVSNRKGVEGHEISISCSKECSHQEEFMAKTINDPVYIMLLRDGVDRVATLWTTGSAYQIEVYRLGPIKIEKALSIGAKAAPSISFNEQGNEELSIETANGARVYTWLNDKYVMQ